jgi:Ca2+-binding RTX toxin-like protein
MSNHRNSIRKYRTFHTESLERRETMSAAPLIVSPDESPVTGDAAPPIAETRSLQVDWSKSDLLTGFSKIPAESMLAALSAAPNRRILGEITPAGADFPYVGRIGVGATPREAFWAHGTGLLIDDSHVLTAKHSFQSTNAQGNVISVTPPTEAWFGLPDPKSILPFAFAVEKIYFHPTEDLAILKLEKPFTLPSYPKLSSTAPVFQEPITLVGYQRQKHDLRYIGANAVDATHVPNEPNRFAYRWDGSPATEAINQPGDSGAPVFRKVGNDYEVIGVVQGAVTAKGVKPGEPKPNPEIGDWCVAIRVDPYLPWINALVSDGKIVIPGSTQDDQVTVDYDDADPTSIVVKSNGAELLRAYAWHITRVDFSGGAGRDVFTNNTDIDSHVSGGAGHDELIGGDGNDVFDGGAGHDVLKGRGGDDKLYGKKGKDDLDGGVGMNELVGGKGNDVYRFADLNARTTVRDSVGENALDFSALNDGVKVRLNSKGRQPVANGLELKLSQPGSIANVIGTKKNDEIYGNDRDNRLDALDGDDLLYGAEGNDVLNGGQGADRYAFIGDQTGFVSIGESQPRGEEEANILDFRLLSRPIDVDLTRAKFDVCDGMTLIINRPEAIIDVYGTAYDDNLLGNSRANELYGEEGNDVINGKGGDDVLLGGTGNDIYRFEGAQQGSVEIWDYVNEGVDTLHFNALSSAVNIDLGDADTQLATKQGLYLTLAYRDSIEHVEGTNFDDTLTGNSLANTLKGGAGNDTISGAAGNDKLYGETDNDRLDGGADDDYVDGSYGNDRFYATAGTDTLSGFHGDDIYTFSGSPIGVYNIWDAPNEGSNTLDFRGMSRGVNVHAGWTSQQEVASGLFIDLSHDSMRYIHGSNQDDELYDSPLSNTIFGYGGNDLLYSNSGGRDRLYGGDGRDDLLGRGNIEFYGEGGNDYINVFNDKPYGRPLGQHRIYGGADNDAVEIYNGWPGEQADGGSGHDLAMVDSAGENITGFEEEVAARSFQPGWAGRPQTRKDASMVEVVNGVPTAGNDTATTRAGSAIEILVRQNDSDPDGDELHVRSFTQGANGQVVVKGPNHPNILVYTPKRGFVGQDTFRYTVGDGRGGQTTGIVTVTVLPDDPVPQAQLSANVLLINGTSADDKVSVSSRGGQLVVQFNGKEKAFDATHAEFIVFYGGRGDDQFVNKTSVKVHQAFGGAGNDHLVGGSNVDVLYGDAGNDRLEGGDGNDVLSGGDGKDALYGQGGADRLFGESDTTPQKSQGNQISAYDQALADLLDGGAGDDALYGGLGNDVLKGDAGYDFLYGEWGQDSLYGGAGVDHLFGGDGNDLLFGGAGNDLLHGNAGDDRLDGEAGDDMLNGNHGKDRLVSRDGRVGNDQLFGGDGDDWFDAPTGEIKKR